LCNRFDEQRREIDCALCCVEFMLPCLLRQVPKPRQTGRPFRC
jgi:hypothetical protein